MRAPVAIRPLTDKDEIQYGVFVGLVKDEGCDRCSSDQYVAAVQLDGHGMILSLFHPSRVVMVSQVER